MTLMSLKKFLSPDFNKINKIIKHTLSPEGPVVNNESYELFKSGGKKIRPTFTLLAGKLGDPEKYQQVLNTSAALELIHMATLVHDDIIDDSNLRRGQSTVYYKHGYFQAVNTGNYLLANSIYLVSDIKHHEFHNTFSKAIESIVEGELIQFNQQFDALQTMEDYYRKIYRKTALLIEMSVKLGGYAGNVEQSVLDALIKYGYHIGMSFQIIDDCLDFIGDEKSLGKPKFSDLQNGHYTLPVLLLRDKDDVFKEKLMSYQHNPTLLQELTRRVLESSEIDNAVEISNNHIAEADNAIRNIEEPYRAYFLEISKKLKNRLN
ncbi:polyprenyl synthetase family protein [Corticicoccus populi]|uniref:Polyprenyl synthetase family protein n=1 Tax=Corticicoccus populi TaxID=1812821 RepID=A0ABW5WRC3_9STAP